MTRPQVFCLLAKCVCVGVSPSVLYVLIYQINSPFEWKNYLHNFENNHTEIIFYHAPGTVLNTLYFV